MEVTGTKGPLAGLRILELAGIGPVPYAGMLLSDLGATVIRIDRIEPAPMTSWPEPRYDVMARGRRSIRVDLKHERGRDVVLDLVAGADALIEGFRPGVAERVGIGPDVCLARNPKLVYGRMTGWGQDGPLAPRAGHDINYIALTGALHAIGPADGPPSVPLNLIGDFGGGATFLVIGVLAALVGVSRTGSGQVVDAAMIDGVASLMAALHGAAAAGYWHERRGTNLLDGGAHFYGVYETRDGKHLAVGAIEPQFYAELLARLGIDAAELPFQHDREAWPAVREQIAARFRTKTREEWCKVFEGSDSCVAPVLSLAEAYEHPHMIARGVFREVDGVMQAAPAPRFSRTPGAVQSPPGRPGEHTDAILRDAGYAADTIAELRSLGVVG